MANSSELLMGYKSLETVFTITSNAGATTSLSLAELLLKKKVIEDDLYWAAYLKPYVLGYESDAGHALKLVRMRDCHLILLLDNLVRLQHKEDPGRGENRSKQFALLPVTTQGLPLDCSVIASWHDARICDGSEKCLCKRSKQLTKDDIPPALLQLSLEEKGQKLKYEKMCTFGFMQILDLLLKYKEVESIIGKQAPNTGTRNEDNFLADFVPLEDSTDDNIRRNFPSLNLQDSKATGKDSDSDSSDEDSDGYETDSSDSDSEEDTSTTQTNTDIAEESMLHHVLDALDKAVLEEVSKSCDQFLNELDGNSSDPDHNDSNSLNNLETDFGQLNIEHHAHPLPILFGFKKHTAPPLLTRHPQPFTGRDDDPAKLEEIVTDVMEKMGMFDINYNKHRPILIGADNKIGKNVLLLMKKKKFARLLPEFPCLHLRKSCITITFSAYQNAGLIEILQYMRNDNTNEWAKMVEASHIDMATHYTKRLAAAIRLAVMVHFLSSLLEDDAAQFLKNISENPAAMADCWYEKFDKFVKDRSAKNANFALHIDMMTHLEMPGAVALAERLGGREGYNLLTAYVKSALPFSFLNGASSYAPFTLQLLYHHHRVGPFDQNLKQCLFSTPLNDRSSVNMACDTKREHDHQVITKSFRSGSTMDSIIRRTSLADELSEVHKVRQEQRKQGQQAKSTTVEKEDRLGWTLDENDINYILPTVLLILRRGGLDDEEVTTPVNVYRQKKTVLPISILDKNSANVGEYLILKYICKEGLFGCSGLDLPDASSLTGEKDLISRAVRSKGVTMKRTSKTKVMVEKSERQRKEDHRKREVAAQVHRVECLSSEMNACQSLLKPDCSKKKVMKSTNIANAMKNILSLGSAKKLKRMVEKEKYIENTGLVYYRANKKEPLPPNLASKVRVAIIEFAGVKFKTSAISGDEYLRSVTTSYIEQFLSIFQGTSYLVLVEEKYGLTPDDFKAATREQRKKDHESTIHHLKTGEEILSSETFSKDACIETAEGKSLISNYVAKHITKLKIEQDVFLEVDSELITNDCTCPPEQNFCHTICPKYCTPVSAKYGKDGFISTENLDDIKQRKGEGEMAAADWLIDHQKDLKPGEAAVAIFTSGDIDALLIFLFVVASKWPRNERGSFGNPVFILLQKPSGMDVYNITRIIEKLERQYKDIKIGVKVALLLCLGGNDFLPNFYRIVHSKLADQFFGHKEFYDKLFLFEPTIAINQPMYLKFVKHLFCNTPANKPLGKSYDDARAETIKVHQDPRRWMPPKTAIFSLCALVDLQIKYLLTAGDASATKPNFLAPGCLVKSATGEIEYCFGQEAHLSKKEIAEFEKIKTPSKAKRCRKRGAENTPGRRKKVQITSSSPVKRGVIRK